MTTLRRMLAGILVLVGCQQSRLEFVCDTPSGRPDCDVTAVKETCIAPRRMFLCQEPLDDARCDVAAPKVECGGELLVGACCAP
jgi:hypothetical protein